MEPDRLPPLVRGRGVRRGAGHRDGDRAAGAAAAPPAGSRRAPGRRAPRSSPPIGKESLERAAPTVEIAYKDDPTDPTEYAVEITYEGLYELAEETLADGSSQLLDEHFGALGGWIASTLVRLGDLKLDYLPADEGDQLP